MKESVGPSRSSVAKLFAVFIASAWYFKLILLVFVTATLLIATAQALNVIALDRAHQLCKSISVGQKLTDVIMRAHNESIFVVHSYPKHEGLVAVFPSFGTDKAICFVESKAGLVTNTHAELLLD